MPIKLELKSSFKSYALELRRAKCIDCGVPLAKLAYITSRSERCFNCVLRAARFEYQLSTRWDGRWPDAC